MDTKVLEYLKANRISVLATLLPDGSPHSATLHYSHQESPLELYFSTENTSRKCQAMLGGKPVKGAVTIGFSEQEWITLQMEGDVQLITDPEQINAVKLVHYPKHPNSQKFENDPATTFLKFTPTWWRFTDFNTAPVTHIESAK